VEPVDPSGNEAALANSLTASDFAAFAKQWETPQLHTVFTAHPTFLMSDAQSKAVAEAASQSGDIGTEVCLTGTEKEPVTLVYEHGRAMDAIANAQDARDGIVSELLGFAAQNWPDQWTQLTPLPFRFASWVGYDMDGRTDIRWFDSIGFRLSEKVQRLERYTAGLEAIDADHALLDTLRLALAYAQERAADFAEDLSEPKALSDAAADRSARKRSRQLRSRPRRSA